MSTKPSPAAGPRVAIVGSRAYPYLKDVHDYVRLLAPGSVVISGGADGVDKTAAGLAIRYGLRVEVFKPDWAKHGRAAGPMRNAEIVAAADRVAAFWDGKSRGTADTIQKARAAGKPVEVFRSDLETP